MKKETNLSTRVLWLYDISEMVHQQIVGKWVMQCSNGTKGYVILITICVPPSPPTTPIHSLYIEKQSTLFSSSSLQSMNLIINYPKIYTLIYSPAFIHHQSTISFLPLAISSSLSRLFGKVWICLFLLLLFCCRFLEFIFSLFVLYHVFFFVACFVVINQSINITY